MLRFVPLFAVGLLAVSGTASAQYHYDHSNRYDSNRYDERSDRRYDRRSDRYDDYRGHNSIYHPSPSTSQPHSNYVQPQSYYPQPSYTPQPSYPPSYSGSTHSHNHVQPRRSGNRGAYGGYSHIDDLAVQFERQVNSMCLEMHDNYQHNPGFKQTYREAYQILQTAKQIHSLVHSGQRDRNRIRQAVVEIDSLFHHVQDDVRNWTRHNHNFNGRGGLPAKMAAVEDTLHHLMNDVGVKTQF